MSLTSVQVKESKGSVDIANAHYLLFTDLLIRAKNSKLSNKLVCKKMIPAEFLEVLSHHCYEVRSVLIAYPVG